MTKKVNIEIDGQSLEVPQGSMIIEAADDANIYIPRFCYHRKLSIAANCRMCLVEVEKSKKPLPACATPVTEGMKIYTRSPMAIESQKIVMEFLLINHPLDCPVCDQGGECELQDLSVGYGQDDSAFSEKKRSVEDENIGPLIETYMTRCIHCTRCIRFGTEIAGLKELGMCNRGEHSEVTSAIKSSLKSELSGNIIDLCPVGALTSKPFRFQARSWEMKLSNSVSPHDCIGSHLTINTRRNEVLRVLPKEHEPINETWISDRDRFSYLGLYQERLAKPLIRERGELKEVDWSIALNYIYQHLGNVLSNEPNQVGAFISPSSSVEEHYLLQKFLAHFKIQTADFRLKQNDFTFDISYVDEPVSEISLNEIENHDCIILVGSNPRYEQPILNYKIRQAFLNGTKVFTVNPLTFDFNYEISDELVQPDLPLSLQILALIKALQKSGSEVDLSIKHTLDTLTLEENTYDRFVQKILEHKKPLLILGQQANIASDFTQTLLLTKCLAKILSAKFILTSDGSNSLGAWRVKNAFTSNASVLTENWIQACQENRKAYILYNVEPEYDFANPNLVRKALKKAEFVLSFSPYLSEDLLEHASVILPITPVFEMSGTFINLENKIQPFEAATLPYQESRPGWKVLRVLGNFFKLSGFEYGSASEITQEFKSVKQEELNKDSLLITRLNDIVLKPLHISLNNDEFIKLVEWPIYRCDNLVRRSQALQETETNLSLNAFVNSAMIDKFRWGEGQEVKISANGEALVLKVMIDNRLCDQTILIPAGYKETAILNFIPGKVSVKLNHE